MEVGGLLIFFRWPFYMIWYVERSENVVKVGIGNYIVWKCLQVSGKAKQCNLQSCKASIFIAQDFPFKKLQLPSDLMQERSWNMVTNISCSLGTDFGLYLQCCWEEIVGLDSMPNLYINCEQNKERKVLSTFFFRPLKGCIFLYSPKKDRNIFTTIPFF